MYVKNENISGRNTNYALSHVYVAVIWGKEAEIIYC